MTGIIHKERMEAGAPRAKRHGISRATTGKAIRTICGGLAALSFMVMLGTIGGIEQNTMELVPGTIGLCVSLGLFVFFAWLAGAFE